MYVLFEDAGKFFAGRLLTEADTSLQLELESGKRQKVKTANVLLRFNTPTPDVVLAQAQPLTEAIDLDFAWEVLGDDEFSFVEFAKEYFSADASLTEQVAALQCLHNAPQYFRRAGKGRYKKMPADILRLALAAIEKKKELEQRIATWSHQLVSGQCPPEVAEQLYRILFKPDKNTPAYKAVVMAAKASGLPVLRLLQQAQAIPSSFQFHWQRFVLENFPGGTGFAQLPPAQIPSLPEGDVAVFSIDDSATTEIDDAFSVRGLGSGTVTLGIHIAAPSLALKPGDAVDQLARARMSTVYMPGYKITMLPEHLVSQFSLDEGKSCPALSLYLTLDESDLSIKESQTRIERVAVQANLRHDQLESWATEETLCASHWDSSTLPAALKTVVPAHLAFLYRLARHLHAKRIQARGRPEMNNRADYTFKLDNAPGVEPTGQERVTITTRERGSPLDLLVAEAMILANQTWGQWLADVGVPGIYRSQAGLGKGIKVRMGNRPLPHAGMGVSCYAWCTSPLRRYVDLVNQWQLVACVQNGTTAALVAPFKPKDAMLFGVISAFEDAYAAYQAVQRQMETYWTLRYLTQEGLTEFDATVIREQLARADKLPLVLELAGGLSAPLGQRVRLKLGAINELTLVASATVAERLETSSDGVFADTLEDDSETLPQGQGLTIAIDSAMEEDANSSEDVVKGKAESAMMSPTALI
jgi:exoribonuclease-2